MFGFINRVLFGHLKAIRLLSEVSSGSPLSGLRMALEKVRTGVKTYSKGQNMI